MLKFKYRYLTNTLFTQNPAETEQWHEVSPEQQFQGNYQAQGFTLEPQNHWISFRVYEHNIQDFYKLPEELNGTLDNLNDFWTEEKITYYRKYLAKQEEVIFTFTPQEEVEKVNVLVIKWIKMKKKLKIKNKP